MNQHKRREIFARFQAANPRPTTELEFETPFQLLVAVILSAQSTDVGVNKATRVLFARAPTPEAMVELGEDGIRECIKTIGLFNAKAKNVLATARAIVEAYGGRVPDARASLEGLPGVGRKTANVVLNTAFGQDTIAVDTHIFRVSNRIPIAKGRTPLEVEEKLRRHVPKPYRRNAHHWLILHGRYVCTARRPRCGECPILDLCEYPDKHLPETEPPKRPRTRARNPVDV